MAQVADDEVPIEVEKRILECIGMERVAEMVGLKRMIELLGVKRLVKELGAKRLVDEVGLDQFLASLSPAQRRDLKRKLGSSRT